MKKDVNTKNVIFYSCLIIILIIGFDWFLKPNLNFRLDFIDKFFQDIKTSQQIAPERLYVNIWRLTRNEYVDATLNNQDWSRWKLRYLKKIKSIDDAEVAINTMLASLNDPYTKFLKSSAYSKQKVIIDSKITGIGLLFDKVDDKVVVNHVLDNSPAESANIIAGDTIVSLNGKNTADNDINDIIAASADDKVKIVIKRNDELIEKELTKQEIYIKTMNYNITEDNIAIITLSNIMGEKAVEDFKDIILKTNDTKGLIIDLRNNYGGVLANAIQMANFMQNDEELISIETRSAGKYHIYADDNKIFRDKPVIILINKYTASSAEILAGIMKDNINAVLIGENTYGKNSIQQVIPMHNKTGLILTTDKYILPNSGDIHKKGLKPDYYAGKDIQMRKALDIMDNISDFAEN